MIENYPTQHMFVTTDELRKSEGPRTGWNDERMTKLCRKRIKHELVIELVRNNMLNMKTVNRSLHTKAETQRKKFAKQLLPDVNSFKRETHAFAYVGAGLFVHAVAKQHDEDQFIRKVGRQKALGMLESKLKKAGTWAASLEWFSSVGNVPNRVLVEMIRMREKAEPILDLSAEQNNGVIENEDFSIPDRESAFGKEGTIMYAGCLFDSPVRIH